MEVSAVRLSQSISISETKKPQTNKQTKQDWCLAGSVLPPWEEVATLALVCHPFTDSVITKSSIFTPHL